MAYNPREAGREGAHPVDAELALAVARGNVEVVAAGSDPWALLRRGEPHAQCHDGGHDELARFGSVVRDVTEVSFLVSCDRPERSVPIDRDRKNAVEEKAIIVVTIHTR
jgi:hypothetical protein